jgi:hypothetical protein
MVLAQPHHCARDHHRDGDRHVPQLRCEAEILIVAMHSTLSTTRRLPMKYAVLAVAVLAAAPPPPIPFTTRKRIAKRPPRWRVSTSFAW